MIKHIYQLVFVYTKNSITMFLASLLILKKKLLYPRLKWNIVYESANHRSGVYYVHSTFKKILKILLIWQILFLNDILKRNKQLRP